jgi:hypothetical protein
MQNAVSLVAVRIDCIHLLKAIRFTHLIIHIILLNVYYFIFLCNEKKRIQVRGVCYMRQPEPIPIHRKLLGHGEKIFISL